MRFSELEDLAEAGKKRFVKELSKSISQAFESSLSNNKKADKKNLQNIYVKEVNNNLVSLSQKIIAGALLLGFAHAENKIALADVEALPFEEAISFLKGKVPMTKSEWLELEPKLRFRAFTVARLAEIDNIERMKKTLVQGLKDGKSFAETWQTVKNDFENIGAGYFETVYRTNIQSAYSAGRLLQYQNNMPPAWELLVIEDGRTSDICKGIVSQIGNGHALPSNHYFWKKVGFPPYHFNCRTSFRAVYDYEIKDGTTNLINTPLKDINFKPQKGFGGNPLENGNWWNMTPAMIKRALRYGIIGEVRERLESAEDAKQRIKNVEKRMLSETKKNAVKAFPKEKQKKVQDMINTVKVEVNKTITPHHTAGFISIRNEDDVATFLHEFAHEIDFVYNDFSLQEKFTRAFITDKRKYVNRMTEDLTKRGLKLYDDLQHFDDNEYLFFKDSVEALTKHEVYIKGSSRPKGYYKSMRKQQKEVFANMLEIQVYENASYNKTMRHYMPNLYKQVAKFIKIM